MKKTIFSLITFILCLLLFVGCGSESAGTSHTDREYFVVEEVCDTVQNRVQLYLDEHN